MNLEKLRRRRCDLYGQWHWFFLLLVAFFDSTLLAGQWNQPGGPGSPMLLRFSYSNLFQNGGLDLTFSEHELVQEVEDAMTVFTRYVPISFVQVADGSTSNIRIGRTGLDGDVIGVADLPSNDNYTGTLQMWLDDSDRAWSNDWPRAVTAHEIGHNLGLEHWEGGLALMNPGISGPVVDQLATIRLFDHDITDVRSKYGTGTGVVRNRRYFLGPLSQTNWDDDAFWWPTAIESPSTGPALRPTTNSHVTIVNGSVLIDGGTKSVRTLDIGSSPGQTTDLLINGGMLTLREDVGINVGISGSGRVQQLGGTVNTPQLRLGAPAGGTASYELLGGTLDVRGAIDDTGTGESTFVLRGGTLPSHLITSVETDVFEFDYQAADAALIWGAFPSSTTFNVLQDFRLGSVGGHTATFDLRGGSLHVGGDITDGPGESQLWIKGGMVTAEGDITVDQILLTDGQLDGGGGTITLSGGSPSPIHVTGGTLENVGTIDGPLVQEGGTLMLGASPAIMAINGDYLLDNQGVGGSLFIQIGGLTAGDDHDKLWIGGTATFGGTLRLKLIDNYVPSAGNRFDILDFNAASGNLTLDASLAPLPEGLVWQVDDLMTTGELFIGSSVVLLSGDYDGSGQVELNDLNLVLFNWNSSSVPSEWINEIPALTVGLDQLNGVLFNWGDGLSVASVPEPSVPSQAIFVVFVFLPGIMNSRQQSWWFTDVNWGCDDSTSRTVSISSLSSVLKSRSFQDF